jgi:hypothetical protein
MTHKFSANASNLILIHKKTGSRGHYNFIFFLNHVLRKTERTSEKPTKKTPNIFLFLKHLYLTIYFYFYTLTQEKKLLTYT